MGRLVDQAVRDISRVAEREPKRPAKPDREFSVLLRASCRAEDLLAARSRVAQLEEDARARGFEIKLGAVGELAREAA